MTTEKYTSYEILQELAKESEIELSDKEFVSPPLRQSPWWRRLQYWWARTNPWNWR